MAANARLTSYIMNLPTEIAQLQTDDIITARFAKSSVNCGHWSEWKQVPIFIQRSKDGN